MKIKYPINLHKLLTFIIVLGLMLFYDSFSTAAFVYLGLHNSYGFMWLMKDKIYPDQQWEKEVPIIIGIFTFLILSSYWIAPLILISNNVQATPILLSTTVSINLFGIFLHYGSDAQKYFVLKQKKGLITDGFFSRSRNPNYLGEILIYLSLAMLAQHWLPFLVLGVFSVLIFVPNMLKKDRSLARYPEFAAYKQNSGLLLPKVFVNKQARTSVPEKAKAS